jgi:hypothetical protein
MATCMRGPAGRSALPGLAAALTSLATVLRLLAAARSSRFAVTSVALVRTKGHAPRITRMVGFPNIVEVFPTPLTASEIPREPPTYRPVKASPTHPAALQYYPGGRHVVALITATRGVTCRDSNGSAIVQAWCHGVGAPI